LSSAIVGVLAAAEDPSEPLNPIIPEVNELFYGLIFFLALWALMKFVFLPPVQRTMQARTDKIRGDMEKADAIKAEAEAETEAYQQSLAAARAESVRIIEAARAEAEAHRLETVAAAERKAAQLRSEAAAEIAAAKRAAMAEMHDSVGSVAVRAASVVVKSDLDPDAQRQAVQDYLNQATSAN